MSSLTSAGPPPIGPDDHVRGVGLPIVLYVDLGCPHCASVWLGLQELELQLCMRHFPIPAQHPRSPALHSAAEAAANQDGFWPFVDRLFGDRGRTDDPHLWAIAEELSLDLDRFEADRRSRDSVERVERDFRSGVRAGVVATPAAFASGEAVSPPLHRSLREMIDR